MKKIFHVLAFLATFCSLPVLSQAQAGFPFNINNSLNCPVRVRWMVYCPTCSLGTPQVSNGLVGIGPLGSLVIPAPVFMAATGGAWTPANTNVDVYLESISGVSLNTLGLTIPLVNAGTPFFVPGAGYPCGFALMTWQGVPNNVVKIQ